MSRAVQLKQRAHNHYSIHYARPATLESTEEGRKERTTTIHPDPYLCLKLSQARVSEGRRLIDLTTTACRRCLQNRSRKFVKQTTVSTTRRERRVLTEILKVTPAQRIDPRGGEREREECLCRLLCSLCSHSALALPPTPVGFLCSPSAESSARAVCEGTSFIAVEGITSQL